ncbi:MAG TPA: ornithine cyclodeaminase family protein [Chloroflexota bacterium]|jgi:ornithine cyclodeaminase/alanine dehydrogenase-like protein (mu-crystallin family)|nr:ornithine cyclodeaminase family protein [Chloroflexota bacterium]
MVLLLNEAEVSELYSIQDALDGVELALRELGEGVAVNQPRNRVMTGNGSLQVMSGYVPGARALGLKFYSASRTGASFAVPLFDSDSGQLLAIMEANTLGQIRTGAASGVATRLLARADASSVAVIGSGWQARTQLEAVCSVRSIKQVNVYSRDADRRAQFARAMGEKLGIEVRAADSGEDAVLGTDIVIVITNARTPVLEGAWLQPGMHVNAAGSNRAQAAELDVAAVARADVITVDQLADAQIESGDLIAAVQADALAWEHVIELGDILAGKATGRISDDQITLFESQGLAIEDLVAARHVYDLAVKRGVGTEIPLFVSGGGKPRGT